MSSIPGGGLLDRGVLDGQWQSSCNVIDDRNSHSTTSCIFVLLDNTYIIVRSRIRPLMLMNELH